MTKLPIEALEGTVQAHAMRIKDLEQRLNRLVVLLSDMYERSDDSLLVALENLWRYEPGEGK